MTRVATSNYAGSPTTTFMWATTGADRFSRTSDLYYLAQAVENHDHSAGKGLAVSRITNGGVVAVYIGTGAVETDKIAALAVTAAKIADLAITSDKLAADAVTTTKITNLGVTTAKINDLAVTEAKLGALAVTEGKIGALAVTEGKIGALAVTEGKIGALAVTEAKIGAGAVTATKIANDTITATQIAPNAIGSSELADDAVDTNAIAALAVTAAKLAADSVTEAKLDCIDSPANDEVLTYDSGTGRLEWQAASALITPGAVVPSGLIAAFATAAAIASGWARYTALNNRVPVGATAGVAVFGVEFTENTAYGSSWGHSHTIAHTHTDSGHGHGMGASNDNQDLPDTGSGTLLARSVHEHNVSFGSAVISGSTVADSGSTSWTIPSYAVVWAQKS